MTARVKSSSAPSIGFLGAGWISCLRLKSLVDSGVADVAAVADPVSEAREHARQIAPAAALVRDIEHLLEFDLDGIVIATPNYLHYRHAIAALKHGRAVFCEKPLALNAKEAARILDTAESTNTLLEIDFSYRFTAGLVAVRKMIHAGAVGHVFSVDMTFHNAYGPDKSWFYDKTLSGGGCMIDLGIHLVDAGLWLLDFPRVVNVRSELFAKGHKLESSDIDVVEDYATATIELSGSTVLRLACSWRMPIGQDALIRIMVHGTRGSVEFSNVEGSFYHFRADFYDQNERREVCSPPDDWGGRAITNWASRLEGGARFDPSVRNVLKCAEVIDIIYGRDRLEMSDGLHLEA